MSANPVTVVLAEDDPDDQLLVREAFDEADLNCNLRIVSDGEELLEYLNRFGKYEAPDSSPRPSLILLDLNMPRLDGHGALKQIRSHEIWRKIPIVVFSTSSEDLQVTTSFELGANAYLTKPSSFEGLVDLVKVLDAHWFKLGIVPQDAP